MKRSRASKTTGVDQVEKRRDWLRFHGFARMQVWVSGGPIQAPHERVLQLLVRPWKGDDESWTVYRHEAGANNDGKIVFKKWNRQADKERFLALGCKEAPKDWRGTVEERRFAVSGDWLNALEQRLGAISIPPIAGAIESLPRDTEYKLSLWRSRQEAEFSWNPPPPTAWKPLAKLFLSLLHSFRRHAEGKPLTSINDL